MADVSLPKTCANVEFVQLADVEGRLVLIPEPAYRQLVATADGMLTIHIPVGKDTVEWLTVTEAAKAHLDDVDGLTLPIAKARISRACDSGQIVHVGRGTKRRIEPTSFAAWRLKEREKNLNRLDD